MSKRLQDWIEDLSTSPTEAIQGLVLGYTGIPEWSRLGLREILIRILPSHRDPLDQAISKWLGDRLMKVPPENTATLVWASHLQELFSAISRMPLSITAQLMRKNLRDFRSWLSPLRTGTNIDPEAAFLSALACSEANRRLEGMWNRLALRRGREPRYYSDIGLLGLRKSRDDQGNLPSKVSRALLTTLIEMTEQLSKKEWVATVRAQMGGYHFSPETWVKEFDSVLQTWSSSRKKRFNPGNGRKWLGSILPMKNQEPRNQQTSSPASPAHSPEEKESMIQDVKKFGPELLRDRLEPFLGRERTYVNVTGDPHFLVRTFNRLADAARDHNPDWAVAVAEEALGWDPDHPFCWTALAKALWARAKRARSAGDDDSWRDDRSDAFETLWEARFRFWWIPVFRSELKNLYIESGDLETADAIIREAAEEFPNDKVVQGDLKGLSSDQTETSKIVWDLPESSGSESLTFPTTPPELLRPAHRLGLALLALWQARETASLNQRQAFFAKVDRFLELPDVLAGECQMAFVEARGFALLARDSLQEAREYFEEQIAKFSPPSLGLRLGFSEVRIRQGETISDEEEVELVSYGPDGSILPLVLKVLRLVGSGADDEKLRDLLLKLYPQVRELSKMPRAERGDDPEEDRGSTENDLDLRDRMVANILDSSVFVPAEVKDTQSLEFSEAISRIRDQINQKHSTLFSVLEQDALTVKTNI